MFLLNAFTNSMLSGFEASNILRTQCKVASISGRKYGYGGLPLFWHRVFAVVTYGFPLVNRGDCFDLIASGGITDACKQLDEPNGAGIVRTPQKIIDVISKALHMKSDSVVITVPVLVQALQKDGSSDY